LRVGFICLEECNMNDISTLLEVVTIGWGDTL
jgi:hypothetical protein